jgi:cell division septal protein FtsQ
MSGIVRHRRLLRRLATRVLPALLVLGLTATLVAAIQVRQVLVTGAHRFAAREVETVLRSALGTPTIAARASELRDSVRALPWVADATVRISLDGLVSCAIIERTPVAVAVDPGVRQFLDGEGRLLAPAGTGGSFLELDGFAAYPEERAAVLAAATRLERCWNDRLQRIERVGPHDIALGFAGTSFPVLADPESPQLLVPARKVLDAWLASRRSAPLRVDARVPGRVAVLPARFSEEAD